MKFIITFFIAAVLPNAWSATYDKSITGTVKSFNEKSIVIEKNGQFMEFDIKRVKDRKKLKTGASIEISLEQIPRQ